MKTHTPTHKVDVQLLFDDMRNTNWTDNAIEYVIRAVNSHDALVEAVKAISAFVTNPTRENEILLNVKGAIAIKAIAQAEGGK